MNYESPPAALRTAALVALGALGLALIGSLIFWQERALYLDAPHILFRIINSNSLQIQEGRIGSFITQGVALIASRMGLPLKAILILYSLSFPLFYLLSGAVLYRFCRRYDLVILLAGYHILLCTATWYWTNNEVHQGVTWMLLVYGLTQRLSRRYYVPSFLLFCAGMYLALFTHPLVMIPALSLWGAWALTKTLPWKSKYLNIAATVALLLLCIWKFSTSAGSGGYETGKMGNVQHMKPIEVIRSFSGPVAVAFYRKLLFSYPGFLALLLAGIYAALRHGKKLLLLWCLLCIVGHLSLLGLTYGSFEAWYMESEWMGFAIPGLALLLYAGRWERWRPIHIAVAGSAIVLVQASYIWFNHAPFTRRIDLSNTILSDMRKQSVRKAILPETILKKRSGDLMVWDAPVQSHFLSALQGDNPQLTFTITASPEETSRKESLGKDSAWECFEPRSRPAYNSKYFSIDTSRQYLFLETVNFYGAYDN